MLRVFGVGLGVDIMWEWMGSKTGLVTEYPVTRRKTGFVEVYSLRN